jgi:hypothetical protein
LSDVLDGISDDYDDPADVATGVDKCGDFNVIVVFPSDHEAFYGPLSGEWVGASISGQPDCKFIRDIEQPCISRFSIVLNAENPMGQAKVIAINHLAWLALPRLMSGIQRHFSVSRFYFAIVEVF